jgi:hypothetical protein
VRESTNGNGVYELYLIRAAKKCHNFAA